MYVHLRHLEQATRKCSCSSTLTRHEHAGRNHLRIVRTLDLGQGFGELALQVAGGRRNATVRATEWAELLVVNGFTYRKILAKYHREDMNNRVRRTCCSSAFC